MVLNYCSLQYTYIILIYSNRVFILFIKSESYIYVLIIIMLYTKHDFFIKLIIFFLKPLLCSAGIGNCMIDNLPIIEQVTVN